MRLFRLVLLCAGISASAGASANAETREDVLSGIQRCGVIRDDRTWLECIYGADQPMRAQLGLPPASEFQQRLVPPVHPGIAAAQIRPAAKIASRKKAGFFQTLIGAAPPVAASRMASYRYEKNGAFVVTLENGEEWRQTETEGGTVSWIKSPSKYLVTVTPGLLGTFTMHTNDSPRVYKVERLK
ncbi:MAG: hypothetical protein NTX21_12015 [Alphaproteobacteria bacterium]|nr:hypothetical protein [Alphaproteobacteria bacterium]